MEVTFWDSTFNRVLFGGAIAVGAATLTVSSQPHLRLWLMVGTIIEIVLAVILVALYKRSYVWTEDGIRTLVQKEIGCPVRPYGGPGIESMLPGEYSWVPACNLARGPEGQLTITEDSEMRGLPGWLIEPLVIAKGPGGQLHVLRFGDPQDPKTEFPPLDLGRQPRVAVVDHGIFGPPRFSL